MTSNHDQPTIEGADACRGLRYPAADEQLNEALFRSLSEARRLVEA
jgi:hypothetical protein